MTRPYRCAHSDAGVPRMITVEQSPAEPFAHPLHVYRQIGPREEHGEARQFALEFHKLGCHAHFATFDCDTASHEQVQVIQHGASYHDSHTGMRQARTECLGNLNGVCRDTARLAGERYTGEPGRREQD